MSKQLENRMPPDRPRWKFETQRTWSPYMSSNPAKAIIKRFKEDTASDDFLRAIVDACISNVAVLDESGSILYANKAWRLFQQSTTREAERYYFESCKRLNESEFEEDADVTLADDLQQMLFDDEREFHRKYYCARINAGRPFIMHAARLNLPGSIFRVLMTREEIPASREDSGHSKERLSQLLETTKVVSWEAEVEDQRFTYVSEQAVRMLGYLANDWYEPNFLASHIHPDDRPRVLSTYRKQTHTGEHFELTFRMIGNDGRVAWVQNL